MVVESSRDILSTLNLVKLVGGHSLNGAIRVCGLWLRNSPEVVAEASDPTSSGVLWSRLAKLFTLLSVTNPVYETHDDVDNAFEEEFAAKDSESLFPEDCLMAGLRFKKSVPQKHRGVKWRGIAGDQNQDEVLVQVRKLSVAFYVKHLGFFFTFTGNQTALVLVRASRLALRQPGH